MNKYLTKILNLVSYIIYRIIDYLIQLKKNKISPYTLLLIRLDSVGDYILLRNYFRFIRDDEKFKNYKITLCGNIIWKNLAVNYDKAVIDNYIWLDRNKFKSSIFYKYKFLKVIYQYGFEFVVDTTYSREILFGDSIVKSSRAKEKIGCTGSMDIYVKWKRNLFSDSYYSKLIPSRKENLFEFYRNKEFFENFLGTRLDIQGPHLDCLDIDFNLPTRKNYLIVFPGAAHKNRIWKPEYFAKVLEEILYCSEFDIILAGTSMEYGLAQIIMSTVNNSRLFNLIGKTSLVELVKIISDAKLVIGNETMGIHMAVAVKTPFVCISTGQHFGRFNPYPKEIFDEGYYVYPDQIAARLHESQKLIEEYRFESHCDINSIQPDRVVNVVNNILEKIIKNKS
jgi:ADP-heptose:LPS heptosyltransferase